MEKHRTGNRNSGFSLIELLIVVAIILVIMAMVIPSLLRSRIAANEASAVGSLRVLNAGEVTYSATYDIGYTCALTALGPPASGNSATSTGAGLVDSNLASGVKSGYLFTPGTCHTGTNGLVDTYQWLADPVGPGTTGSRHFCTDQVFGLRVDPNSSANCLTIGTPVA